MLELDEIFYNALTATRNRLCHRRSRLQHMCEVPPMENDNTPPPALTSRNSWTRDFAKRPDHEGRHLGAPTTAYRHSVMISAVSPKEVEARDSAARPSPPYITSMHRPYLESLTTDGTAWDGTKALLLYKNPAISVRRRITNDDDDEI